MGNEEVRIKEDEGCRATLTLSTDDGEQAGEENDRMAPHHLFSPSFPPRGYFHPAVLQLVFTFLVSCRTRSASVPEDLATRRLQFVGEKAGMLGEENRQLPVSRLDRWNHHDKSNLLIGQALQRGACGGINAWQIRGQKHLSAPPTVGGSDIDTDRFADENPNRDSRDADSQSPYGRPIKSRGTHIRRVQLTTRVIAPFDEPGCQQKYALDPPYIGSDALGAAVSPADRDSYSLQPRSTTCAKLVV
ncbi:hypothetical protein ALC60_14340 [Trachymyrmex zeteki]|uniref:Uncharacterized protein n=1 Tax=Mycetomoellerius zeteki TaxID=64791 RepID=A0A151WFH9_9HYME|nr:hypothetical protein ALC60_14340 [Trachymyrmex zeteki]